MCEVQQEASFTCECPEVFHTDCSHRLLLFIPPLLLNWLFSTEFLPDRPSCQVLEYLMGLRLLIIVLPVAEARDWCTVGVCRCGVCE